MISLVSCLGFALLLCIGGLGADSQCTKPCWIVKKNQWHNGYRATVIVAAPRFYKRSRKLPIKMLFNVEPKTLVHIHMQGGNINRLESSLENNTAVIIFKPQRNIRKGKKVKIEFLVRNSTVKLLEVKFWKKVACSATGPTCPPMTRPPTTKLPMTTMKPKTKPNGSTKKPQEKTTKRPMTTAEPEEITTAEPEEITTVEPEEITTKAPMTTAEPEEITTAEPEEVTTAEPEQITTAEPEEITTAEPEQITTKAPVTTAEPEEVTTAKPEQITTAEPEEITTAEPEEITTKVPMTTVKPELITTAEPAEGDPTLYYKL